MKNISAIIFDSGGMLIDWNPKYVFLEAFNGSQAKQIETNCF